jgi:hypothetical protein
MKLLLDRWVAKLALTLIKIELNSLLFNLVSKTGCTVPVNRYKSVPF